MILLVNAALSSTSIGLCKLRMDLKNEPRFAGVADKNHQRSADFLLEVPDKKTRLIFWSDFRAGDAATLMSIAVIFLPSDFAFVTATLMTC
jgi:hypothetical protein